MVLDTGAASRGSGNANTNKEKEVRKWFVEQDLVEGVIYLPENLFYNTTAPGIVVFLNKDKPKARKGKLFLLNATREFAKGDPKNYITDEGIERITQTFRTWREEEKFSLVVDKTEIARNDYNISPSRYIHTADGEEYRPIAEILEELNALEEEAKTTDAALKAVLQKLGYWSLLKSGPRFGTTCRATPFSAASSRPFSSKMFRPSIAEPTTSISMR